jgi:cytochrome c-type biogenesis protein CcmH/NrfG
MVQEEKNLLKKLKTHPEDIAVFKNLARIYLWQKDFSSARWALLQAFRLDRKDNVVQDLLLELYEKRGGAR